MNFHQTQVAHIMEQIVNNDEQGREIVEAITLNSLNMSFGFEYPNHLSAE